MKKTTQTISRIFALTFAGTMIASADPDGQDIKLADCPAEVRATIEKNAGEGKIDDIEFIQIEDKKMYVADVDLVDGRDRTLYVNATGKLLKISEDIAEKSLPAAVRDAIAKFNGHVDDADKVTEGEKVSYHIDLERRGKTDLELVLSNAGEVISQHEDQDD